MLSKIPRGRFVEYDPILTFRNRRSASFPEAGVRINALGLRGPDVTVAKLEDLRGQLRGVMQFRQVPGGGGPFPPKVIDIAER
jgi:hypothetical protein